MGRVPCCEKIGLNRGKWTSEEDEKLINYIKANGDGCWRSLPKNAGLLRCGKSCRLRWINYLRDDVKRGNFTEDEEETIVKLHKTLGNKWSVIARRLPGRTDNEIKNYWNSHLSRQIYRFRSSGELLLSSVDVIKMAKPSNRRSGRVSRAVAKKYNNNNINLPSVTSTKNSDKISITVVNKQTATKEAGTNCPLDARERDLNPLGSHEDGVPKSSNEDGTFSRCVLSSEDWPSAFMVSPKEGGDREMLGPWEEVNEENLLMQLNKYEEGVAIYGGEDVVISEGTDKVVTDMDSATASEEMYCRDWSSNTEVGSLYGCLSPIVSYFENDELCWNLDGGASAAGNEISFWSEEEDLLIWS